MTTYIALLRGINVGGHATVAMADLRALFGDLGFDAPKTVLQSGNVVFDGKTQPASTLERLLEAEMRKRLDLSVEFFVRSAKDWASVIAANPFRDEAERDPGHLVAMFFKKKPVAKAVGALRAAIKGRETIHAHDRHAYIVYPDGIGRSPFTGTLIETKLGTRGTGRNWNTVLKLAELAQA